MKISVFDEFRGGGLLKRAPNEPKLFTTYTEFLASMLNVTIHKINLMFEKKNISKYEFGGPFKSIKMCPLLIKIYFSEHLRPERTPAARRCACFCFVCLVGHNVYIPSVQEHFELI